VNKVIEGIRRAKAFLGEVVAELRKSSWPTRNELIESTVVVILSVVLFTVFVGVCDTVLAAGMRLLAR
jgi:preprotein translocase subunit SecE